MSVQGCRDEFNELVLAAWEQKLLTIREASAIARAGTRKAGYWCGHLARLRDVLRERGAELS